MTQHTVSARSCDECGGSFTPVRAWQRYCKERCRNRAQRKRGGAITAVWVAGYCAECRAPFVARRHGDEIPRYCSWECKHDVLCGSHAKRVRRRGGLVERVNRRRVFERDGWRCQICRRMTDRTAVVPHPRAPTLDHIVPVTAGGDHTYVNVQCACSECNTRKGNRSANDQLRLIG